MPLSIILAIVLTTGVTVGVQTGTKAAISGAEKGVVALYHIAKKAKHPTVVVVKHLSR